MIKKLYALLVGINNYNHPKVSNLKGCVNDVVNIKTYLESRFDKENRDIECLINENASYQNIIETFRNHLTAKAKKGDVVFFHYSGHGAREVAAEGFRPFFPEGKEETLVCYDSRQKGGHDLADKELAVLISEVAAKGAHVVIVLDCCHSGSGTRPGHGSRMGAIRKTYDRRDTRPIETYIGDYQKQLAENDEVVIPTSKHILLAACDRKQYARETKMHTGLFTTTLLKTLGEHKTGDISYANLYLKCRIRIVNEVDKQTPQFETYSRFNAHSKFLDGRDMADVDKREVYREDGEWVVNYGAMDGLDTSGTCVPQFKIFSKRDETEFLGYAKAGAVFPERTNLNLSFTHRNMSGYYAMPVSLPTPKMLIHLHGEPKSVKRFKAKEKDFLNIAFTDSPRGTKYNIEVKETGIYTYFNHTHQLIQGYENDSFDNNVKFTVDLVGKISRWENGVVLQNQSKKLDASKIDFILTDGEGKKLESDVEYKKAYKKELKEKGETVIHSDDDIEDSAEHEQYFTFYSDKNVNDGEVKIVLKAQHFSRQKLYFALVYFSEEFGIEVYRNEPVDKDSNEIILWGKGRYDFLFLEEEEEYHDVFKLIVSTEPIKDFLLEQMPVEIGRIKEDPRKSSRSHRYRLLSKDWLTKTIHIRLLNRKHKVTETPTVVGDKQRLVIGGHPRFEANIGLVAAQTNSRSVDEFDEMAANVFSRQKGELLSFGAEHGNNGNVLVLNGISGEEALKEQPLEIDVNVATEADEMILSFTYDNDIIVPIGNAIEAEDGSSTKIVIEEIPDIAYPDQPTRSVGKALKLLFFKFMKWDKQTQMLRKVIYHDDGTAERSGDGVKAVVDNASSVLLLIHGIIGDTEQMAEAFRVAQDSEKYDLILTFDYENLNTSIIETADVLYNKLVHDLGLLQSTDKKLDIVAHSMGGLVSRYMIEKLGGDKMVRHLYLCGTPNNGSNVSEVTAYRNMFLGLCTLAINLGFAVPALIVGALTRSKTLTLTLEEMRTKGEFIPKLHKTQQPDTKYTIIAGDLAKYLDKTDEYVKKIINKSLNIISKTFYGSQANDLVVGVDSIKGIHHFNAPKPEIREAICHHMNYFEEDGGFEVVRKEVLL
ncbi:MAG: caspase family protein [Chitinophagales bacterium]